MKTRLPNFSYLRMGIFLALFIPVIASSSVYERIKNGERVEFDKLDLVKSSSHLIEASDAEVRQIEKHLIDGEQSFTRQLDQITDVDFVKKDKVEQTNEDTDQLKEIQPEFPVAQDENEGEEQEQEQEKSTIGLEMNENNDNLNSRPEANSGPIIESKEEIQQDNAQMDVATLDEIAVGEVDESQDLKNIDSSITGSAPLFQ